MERIQKVCGLLPGGADEPGSAFVSLGILIGCLVDLWRSFVDEVLTAKPREDSFHCCEGEAEVLGNVLLAVRVDLTAVR